MTEETRRALQIQANAFRATIEAMVRKAENSAIAYREEAEENQKFESWRHFCEGRAWEAELFARNLRDLLERKSR